MNKEQQHELAERTRANRNKAAGPRGLITTMNGRIVWLVASGQLVSGEFKVKP